MISFLRNQYRFVLALVVLIAAIMLSLLGLHDIARWAIYTYSGIIALVLLVGMVRDLLHGKYGVDILAIVAITSTIAVDEYWATIVIVVMLTGGEALEAYAGARARAELTALMSRVPKTTHKQTVDGTIVDIAIAEVSIGDVLYIRPAEVIPVDGTVQSPDAIVDESSLTGESEPVELKRGDTVLSGAVNGNSELILAVTKRADDSEYAQIVKLVQAAADAHAPFVRLADRYAVPFTAVSFAIASLAWWLSGQPERFAEVLVVATPCPLLLAAPIAMISGMSRAAKHGIIIKNGGALEQLARVRSAAFDKTGTLTAGTLTVAAIQPAKGVTAETLLSLAASAESASTHIVAAAVVAAAQDRHVKITTPDTIEELPGRGITALLGGQTIRAGKPGFLAEHGVMIPREIAEHVQTGVYVARGDQYVGAVLLGDALRPNAKATIEQLGALGVGHVVMLTGDGRETAERIGAMLGLSEIHAECMPQDKLRIMQAYQPRPIMMVGDGVNDAPVLAASDVGIAMGARGATAASESADVVILVDDFGRVATSVQIARRTLHIARQSVLAGIFASIGLMLVASTGVIPAVIGAGLQELVDVIVIINALRAHSAQHL